MNHRAVLDYLSNLATGKDWAATAEGLALPLINSHASPELLWGVPRPAQSSETVPSCDRFVRVS
ncbi:MAG: hypothetical protein ICV55_14565 [Coleofasciculus sp. C3-bin4]|nr:hypothetical protein [Coleofasciculus sp. C3-bin4]